MDVRPTPLCLHTPPFIIVNTDTNLLGSSSLLCFITPFHFFNLSLFLSVSVWQPFAERRASEADDANNIVANIAACNKQLGPSRRCDDWATGDSLHSRGVANDEKAKVVF